jgi:hypothetical protein
MADTLFPDAQYLIVAVEAAQTRNDIIPTQLL